MSKNDDERRILTIGRPTGFLYIRDKIEMQPEDEDPMLITAPWSRFEICITEKGNGSVSINIDLSDIQGAVDKTNFAFFKHQEALLTSARQPNSPAYNIKFKAGRYKGMTPAEILSKGPEEKNELLVQREFLEKNLKSYPKNREIITAIDDAISKYDTGKLSLSECSESQGIKIPVLIYPVKPNKKIKNKDGLIKIAKLDVQYVIGAEYPVEISITNLWAPLKDDEPVYSQAQDQSLLSFTLKHEEWSNLLHTMQLRADSFTITHELTARKRAEAITNAARQNNRRGD